MSARGLFHSGPMAGYRSNYTRDLERAEELSQQIPTEDVNYNTRSLQQLEEELVLLDRTKGQIDNLIGTYRASIQEDEK